MASPPKDDRSAAKDPIPPSAASIYEFLISCLRTDTYASLAVFSLFCVISFGSFLGRPLVRTYHMLLANEPDTAWPGNNFAWLPFYVTTLCMLLAGIFRNGHEFECLTDSTSRKPIHRMVLRQSLRGGYSGVTDLGRFDVCVRGLLADLTALRLLSIRISKGDWACALCSWRRLSTQQGWVWFSLRNYIT